MHRNSLKKMTTKPKCKLNSDGSVSLKDILDSFNSSIREEHAWALCYQCAKFFYEATATTPGKCKIVTDVSEVFLQTDGNIHPNTLFGRSSDDEVRKRFSNEQELVTELGFVIYSALEYGTNNGGERKISQDLEQLITDMISNEQNESRTHHETDDEGIEKDSEETDDICSSKIKPHITLQQVLQRCERRLVTLTKSQAESHYKAVVRALVAEGLELSTFLEKVAQGTSNLKLSDEASNTELDQLKFADWAKFWVQVMNELRTGVKLKKVHYTRAPIEYELTPYEILMKDIRSCRYSLRKIIVDGNTPSRVTKDAHAIILEFIRSRPPLKKVTDRKLPPHNKKLTPHEQLMNSIKKGRTLRKTEVNDSRSASSSNTSIDRNQEPSTSRRLIKVDFSQLIDDEDEDDDTQKSDSSESCGLWPQEEYRQIYGTTLEAYDLALQCPEPKPNARRNTLDICQIDGHLGSQSVPQSRPCSRQSCTSSEVEFSQLTPDIAKVIQDPEKPWHEAMSLDDRLSLTLEEIVHIRTVLTKAELEALPVEGHIKSDVENRKVCFLCLKTRFGVLGPWGQRCNLCKRTVCSKCCSRMYIPMEYFSSVPVVLLSPSIMATPENEQSPGFPKFPQSEKNSPANSRQASPSTNRPASSLESRRFRAKALAVGKAAAVVEKVKRSHMVVCQDCKMMVLQIIKSAQANRSAIRNKTLQTLTLNLSPVF